MISNRVDEAEIVSTFVRSNEISQHKRRSRDRHRDVRDAHGKVADSDTDSDQSLGGRRVVYVVCV